MLKFIITALFLLSLTGCASYSPYPYGNFVADTAQISQQEIANDALDKLSHLYPPAKTRFLLEQPTPDIFGSALISGLRERGYAVLEFEPQSVIVQQYELDPSAPITTLTPETEIIPVVDSDPNQSGLSLYYVLDQFIGTNMYRVTLTIGDTSLSRAYLQDEEGIVPIGYWVRKE